MPSHSESNAGRQQPKSQGAQIAAEAGAKLRETASQTLEHGRERAGEYIDQGREMAADYLERGRERAGEYLEEGRERAMELQSSLEDRIRQQPMNAVLCAAGVGFVLGILFNRR